MKNYNRDLLLLYKEEVYNDDLLQKEVECLHEILMQVERNEIFCQAHELVARHKITRKAKTIVNAISDPELRPFHFLINKN
ncbi:MAG TPA: hypothetical protein VMR70_10360 [Flavisolibacter sp.]|nr:hypothetical protein [Flavisolibacter sp.]